MTDPIKTWIAGEILFAADLNAEFANIYDNINTEHIYTWHFNGSCTVRVNDIIWRVGTNAETVDVVKLTVPTGGDPSGQSLIVDIKEDGTTLFSTKPEIDASGTEEDGNEVFSNTSLAADAQLTCEVTQIGSGDPGSNLTVQLYTHKT